MLINKSLWIKVGVVVGAAAVVGAVVGGYFGISKSDQFRNYYVTPTDDTPRGFLNAYKNAIYNGASAILTPGFTHKDPIVQSFSEYKSFFEDVGFLLFDEKYSYEEAGSSNVWSITFRSDLGSIQTGIAMCMLLNEYQDVFYDDGKLSYGMYGGLPFSSVTSFMGGIQHGVEWFNNVIVNPDGSYKTGTSLDGTREIEYKPVEEIKSDIGDFAGGFGPSQGSTISNHLINKGIDILIPVAGPQTWTAMNQIILLNKKCLLLGVDSAMEDDPLNKEINFKSNYGQIGNGKYLQFSSIKDLSKAAFKALQIINNGNKVPDVPSDVPEEERENYFTNFSETGAKDEVSGFGTTAVGDINNGCVGVSGAGVDYLEKALTTFDETDPALDPYYSDPQNMYYIDSSNEKLNYGEEPFGLGQTFVDLYQDKSRDEILDLTDFIEQNNSNDLNKIKVVVSGTTSVLMDSSFSQSCYLGMATFYMHMGIDIAVPNSLNSVAYSYKRRYYA